MADTDFERLTRLMLGEFKHAHERFDAIDVRFDAADQRFNTLDVTLFDIGTDLRDIRNRLEALEESAENTTGFAKEIDHLLKRVVALEKYLGLETHIKA